MGRILAIDYGRVRTGLAVTDPLRIIATALATVETSLLLPWLKDYCSREQVDIFVVGEAKHLDGSPSESSALIEPFVQHLHKEVPSVEVARMDERFTSKIAFQSMIDSGLKRKDRRDKGRIDRVAATLILQDYMRMANN